MKAFLIISSGILAGLLFKEPLVSFYNDVEPFLKGVIS